MCGQFLHVQPAKPAGEPRPALRSQLALAASARGRRAGLPGLPV
ncbi:hypothetical protein HMPREF1978_01488 [Actinomyces graevenitzii F0530]|uniref:Uncharacterized protein n=1 Tax=Actinomyces graevenitzii F0530 TaxID=1321817 RepID=U1PDT1_9ACTO|nr:hypothetical protein HMPREF1978_01488 [Actinomyces graevenitzii F0530]